MAYIAGLVEYAEAVDDDYLSIKFEPSLKRSSITNDKFTVESLGATPGTIANPFRPINIDADYNTISKTLKLYWNDGVLDSSTEYKVTIAGLQNALGMSLSGGSFTFTTQSAFTDDFIYQPPKDPVIEDHSIRDDIVIDTTADVFEGSPETAEGFRVLSVFPEDGSIYIAKDENSGIIEVRFSERVNANHLTPTYFRVQRKKMKRGPTRWETLSPQVDQDSADPIVYVKLPSGDSDFSYGEPGGLYFEEGFRYRVIISGSLQPESA